LLKSITIEAIGKLMIKRNGPSVRHVVNVLQTRR